jgi:MFS transporter, YNFM family, putative membrane transport protein
VDEIEPVSPFAASNPAIESIEQRLPPPDTTGLRSFRAVAAVCLCGVFAFLNLYVTQPMLPLLERIFHASKSVVGLTVSSSTLGVALSAPILGALAEQMNRKRVIVACTLLLCVPTLLAATSPGLHSLVFWRFLQGLILPGIFAITITYIGEEWEHHAMPIVMSIYVSGTAMGGFLGRITAGIAAERLSWRWSFLILGMLTLIGAAMIARWLPEENRQIPYDGNVSPLAQLRAMLEHFRNPRLVATFSVGFGMLFALVGTFTYITFYLADPPFHLSTEALSYLFAIYLIGLVVTPAGGYLITRIGMRDGIALAIGACLLGALVTLSHSLWVVVLVGLGLVCTGVFIAQATANSFLRVAAPAGGRTSAAGLYICCYYIGGTVGGVLPAYMWSLGKWPACVALIACVLMITLAIALVGWKMPKERRGSGLGASSYRILARMAGERRSVGRWFLVPVILAASTVAAYLAFFLSFALDGFEIRWARVAHLNFPPSDLLRIADLIAILFTLALWAVPIAWSVGFAMRARPRLSLLWGLSISLLLAAMFVWFARDPFSRIFSAVAAALLVGEIVYFIVRRAGARVLLVTNIAVFGVLLAPRLIVLVSVPKQPPFAHKVWSVVLQKGTWQAMNTGSEFAATRQLTFAGDRIIAVFDAGSAGYEGKVLMSNYRVLSLDRDTGEIKNQMEFTGRWGVMPYIYGTRGGKVAFAGSGLIRLLNPDLSATGTELNYKGVIDIFSPDGTVLGVQASPGMTLLATDTLQPIGTLLESSPISINRIAALSRDVTWDPSKNEEILPFETIGGQRSSLLFPCKCGYPNGFLDEDRVLLTGCGKIHILDKRGKLVAEARSAQPAETFAGVSQNGSRFALQYSDERGDPSVVLYEQFIIYDSATAKPLARVSVDDLPERQSWSAFSPDGRFFAVGNPDKLTLYQIP